MSLQWRVATALAAVAAAATISVGMISYRATDNRLLEEVDDSLAQVLGTILTTRQVLGDGENVLDVFIVQTIDRSGIVVLSNVDPKIAPSARALRVARGEDRRSVETLDLATGELRMLTDDLSDGAIQVGRSLEENDSVLADLRQRTIWVVALVTAAAAVVGWLIALTVTAPLKRLTRAAADVEESGRLDVAVPISGQDEVGRLATAFNGMLGALATSRADQQRLVEDAGHELRTPLTSVRTNVAVLRRHPDLDQETRQRVLDDLATETEQLVVLVEEIVGLARGATDDAVPEPIALGELAHDVAMRAERRHGRPVVVSADDSVVTAPPPTVERAISNLVDNAAKFDRTDGPIEIAVADGAVVVHDRGPGIPADEHRRVFDRFYRTAGARSLPGSGLGLSIVRDVAERNGGTVTIADRPGGGASVGFRLPRSDDSSIPVRVPIAPQNERHVPTSAP
ncbi:MAG: ATP-binding protein [Ilumatobacteraceae bacterium]